MRLACVVALVGLVAVRAFGGDAARSFGESDRNGDGVVDYREMERRALEVFYFADSDKEGHLTREEFQALVLADDFASVDADHDGRISVREFVAARARDFAAADANHDGTLTGDEVK